VYCLNSQEAKLSLDVIEDVVVTEVVFTEETVREVESFLRQRLVKELEASANLSTLNEVHF